MNDLAKNVILWIVIAVVFVTVFQSFNAQSTRPAPLTYSEFLDNVRSGTVEEVQFDYEG